ncbi:unnamed protein product [Adineta ricciae]|uniref:6-pyruvoyltetrahydropterin synthase n=1 Tax=Adineta ricciae TaxID=249248 RepID=A0A814UKW2_ADIRI|nr:unnamed protein product [Adineta ricciae]CAF1434883.1 unnamed protein product [Adineta ricciae]
MSSKSKIYLIRRESFSSAHRLHSNHISDEENLRIYSKCNNLNGHGHNYVLEVTIVGNIDGKTGMVMNISDLKYILVEYVLNILDHKNIDLDVEYFRRNHVISTTENVAIFIWNQINDVINQQYKNVRLYEIKLYETDKNIVVYRGEDDS